MRYTSAIHHSIGVTNVIRLYGSGDGQGEANKQFNAWEETGGVRRYKIRTNLENPQLRTCGMGRVWQPRHVHFMHCFQQSTLVLNS